MVSLLLRQTQFTEIICKGIFSHSKNKTRKLEYNVNKNLHQQPGSAKENNYCSTSVTM